MKPDTRLKPEWLPHSANFFGLLPVDQCNDGTPLYLTPGEADKATMGGRFANRPTLRAANLRAVTRSSANVPNEVMARSL
jgi:hypothetical protein